MRVHLIIHKKKPDALRALRKAAADLRRSGHEVEGRVTFESSDIARFAQEAVTAEADVVVAAGGDGTVNAVVNGFFSDGDGRSADRLPRLGIVPLGTANDLANWLNVPMDVRDALRLAVEGNSRTVDVAKVNDRYFLNVSTGGFAAEATEEAPSKAKRRLGVLAYFAQGLKKFAALEPSVARFTSGDEVIHDGEFLVFAVGNGVRTGGGNLVTPRADMADGLLDLCIVKPMTRGEFLRLAPELRTGEHLESEAVVYRQLSGLRVEGADTLSVNADGEAVSDRSLEYSLRPRALRLSCP